MEGKRDGQEKCLRKNDQDFLLIVFEDHTKKVRSNLIPRLLTFGLGGPKHLEITVRNRKVRE